MSKTKFLHDQPQVTNTSTDQIIKTGRDLNSIFDAIDRAVNPQKYTQVDYQPVPQPQQAGLGWGKLLLGAAVAGTVFYGGKQWYDKKFTQGA